MGQLYEKDHFAPIHAHTYTHTSHFQTYSDANYDKFHNEYANNYGNGDYGKESTQLPPSDYTFHPTDPYSNAKHKNVLIDSLEGFKPILHEEEPIFYKPKSNMAREKKGLDRGL